MGNLSIFGFDFSDDKLPKSEVVAPIIDMEFVHPTDRLIVDVIFECDKYRSTPFIAGGACLAWYQNEPVKTDIDLYFKNGIDYQNFKAAFELSNFFKTGAYTVKASTNNALTYGATDYNTGKNWTIQLIKKKFYYTVEEVLDDFDITVCKIGYDGKRVVTSSTFIPDVATRTLRFDNINPISHKRLVKYMAYGYEPALGEIERLIENETVDWDARGTDHYV